jgi:hypothetical protein
MAKIKTNKKEEPKQLPTVTVTSKLDPRLKAYQDSLRLYNNNPNQNDLNQLLKQGIYIKTKGTIPGVKNQPIAMYSPNTEKMDEYNKAGKNYSYISPTDESAKQKGYKKINGEYFDKDGARVVVSRGIYKKPVQPVEYKEEPHKDTTQRLQENPKAEIKHADVKIEAPKVEKTKYSINYRDDNSETGQSAMYFKTKQEYKDALNKAMKSRGFSGSSEDKQSASALFYNKPNINGKD